MNKSIFRMGRYYILNAAILGMILCIYLLTASPDIHMVMGEAGVSPFYKGNAGAHTVALSIQVDSFGAETAREMMDTLLDEGVTATFFVYGEFAAENPETVRALADNGFEVGTLGYAGMPVSGGDRDALRSGLFSAAKTIGDYTGRPVTLFSPTEGVYARETLDVAKSLGLKTVLWSADAGESGLSSAAVRQRALRGLENGSVIRLRALPEARDALRDITRSVRELDYDFATVGTLIQ
jgi:peptidoglycan/xylan/chitin deacetylase (PgdA/CDA1 family)